MTKSVAFADEVAASRGYLARFARLQLRNDAWVEDVVAETILAALEKPHNFGGKSSVKTWLVAILKYKIIDCMRAHQREFTSSINCGARAELEDRNFASDGDHGDAAYDWANPEQMLNSKQFMAIIDASIDEMPHTMGRVFMMREWLGFSTDEICEELTISRSNVWVLLHRARLRLRDSLQTRWFDQQVTEESSKESLPAWREITVRI